jgi:hypothetical protein
MNSQGLTRADLCAKLVDFLAELRHAIAVRRNNPGARNPRISSALSKLCAGTISVEDYLSIKLDRALEPLEQLLRPDDIAAVRHAMLERIQSEPIWRSVVEELRVTVARGRRGQSDDHDH